MSKRSCFISFILFASLLFSTASGAEEKGQFAGAVSSAAPEATAAGVEILEKGGNAIDAAIAVSLALGVSEPAGSGIGGQTVMLVYPGNGEKPFVIHGTTWSPRHLPDNITKEQLKYGRTASSVPSTLKVLDLAYRQYASGNLEWKELVDPAIRIATDGFTVGPFRQKAFRFYGDELRKQDTAREIYIKQDNSDYQVGEVVRQKKFAKTLERIAKVGAEDFYSGKIAKAIAKDMAENGGWITEEDLAKFPEPRIVEPLITSYRGHQVATLPPPFGGWVMLQILNVLEEMDPADLSHDDEVRRLGLLDAMRIAHGSRRNEPVPSFTEYKENVDLKISKEQAAKLLAAYRDQTGGETTHFSVVDGNGMAVAVTQSIDSYFGAKVAHPELGFLYNNYMQGFRLKDDGSPYVLKPFEMPYSSMSATVLSKDGKAELVLGSPASARIISAVAQVTSFWVDVSPDVEAAVGAFRVHVVPDNKAYVEGPEIGTELLRGMAARGFRLKRPAYGVSDNQYDPYFGGVHALAREDGKWTGAADPRRDGLVGIAWKRQSGR